MTASTPDTSTTAPAGEPYTAPAGEPYTAVVIGAGSGGLTLAIGLAGFGKRVALVESGPVGGDCTNVGCVPSKTLLHAARAGTPSVLPHVRAKRDALEAKEAAELEHDEHIHLIRGSARLGRTQPGDGAQRADTTARHAVEVSTSDGVTHVVRAEHVIICTGARPATIPIDGLPAERLLTNENLFEIDAPPQRLVIVGGGVIALEMATAFADLGTQVDIVELQDRLLAADDPLVSSTVQAALAARGVGIHVSTSIERYDEATRTVHLADGSALDDVESVLLAIGRRPRLDGLELDRAGVEHDRTGVRVDDWGRTNVEGIWAVGDVTGRTATTHGANALGRRTVRAIALPRLPKTGALRAMPNAIYSDPQVATVGMGYAELSALPKSGRRRYELQLSSLDRGYTDGIEHGVAIVDVERFTGKVLRAAIVGPCAAEIIGMFTIAIDHGIGLRKLFGMIHPYPAWAELVGKLVDEFARDTYPALPREWLAMVGGRVSRFRPTRLGR